MVNLPLCYRALGEGDWASIGWNKAGLSGSVSGHLYTRVFLAKRLGLIYKHIFNHLQGSKLQEKSFESA